MGATFAYEAVDRAGRRRRGTTSAASAATLARTLEERGLVVLDVSASVGEPGSELRSRDRPRGRDVLEATRALAALSGAGLPLARALATAATVAPGAVAVALGEVGARVMQGQPLSSALAEHPRAFSRLYVGLIRAGERSGDVAGAFSRLAVQLERDQDLRARLVSASIYPLILAAAGGTAVTVLMLHVLPRFAELLQDTGAVLPRSTTALVGLAQLAERWWPLLVVGLVGLTLAVAASIASEHGRRSAASLVLHLPGVGTFRRSALAARFARLAAVLLGGGAPLVSALDDTAECIGDPIARDETGRIRARVREGAALHAALTESTLFPPLLSQLVAVGEESGRLQEFLCKAADILEERTERHLRRLVALAEPAMILLFGGFVGFVALSLLQAIYSVNAGAFR